MPYSQSEPIDFFLEEDVLLMLLDLILDLNLFLEFGFVLCDSKLPEFNCISIKLDFIALSVTLFHNSHVFHEVHLVSIQRNRSCIVSKMNYKSKYLIVNWRTICMNLKLILFCLLLELIEHIINPVNLILQHFLRFLLGFIFLLKS